MKAVDKFEYRAATSSPPCPPTRRGGSASHHAVRAIADQARTIRIPVHMIETINKLNRIEPPDACRRRPHQPSRKNWQKMDMPRQSRKGAEDRQGPIRLTPAATTRTSGDFIAYDNMDPHAER